MAKFVRNLKQVKTDLLSNSPKRLSRFWPDYEGKENMFYFLIIYGLYFLLVSLKHTVLTTYKEIYDTGNA